MWCKRILMILVVIAAIFAIAAHVSAQETPNIKFPVETETIAILEEEVQKAELIVTEPVETQPAETEPLETEYVEKFPEVPQYFQNDYPDTPYGGHGTVADSGCGITSLAMVLSYLLDEDIMPDALAKQYGHHHCEDGSSYALFEESSKDYEVNFKKINHPWSEVVAALENGQVVIAKPNSKSAFTNSGHYIVLYGITAEGRILVRDPNKSNYADWAIPVLKEGFRIGFEQKSIKYNCFPCWIYEKKDVEALAKKANEQNISTITTEENS